MNTTLFQVAFYAVALANPDIKLTVAIPLAQAVHETGNFTSDVFHRDNNMFGMTTPKIRPTTATNFGGPEHYAHFSNVLDCMRDFFKWARYFGCVDDTHLLAFIKREYAEDKLYYSKITKQMAVLKAADKYLSKDTVLAAGLVALPAAGLAGWAMVEAISHIVKSK